MHGVEEAIVDGFVLYTVINVGDLAQIEAGCGGTASVSDKSQAGNAEAAPPYLSVAGL